MNIVIFGHNSKDAYSGGRYHAWMMAEALSIAGYKVYYVTDNKPLFMSDFACFPKHGEVELFITPNWDQVSEMRADIVIVIPTLFQKLDFYHSALVFAKKNKARVVLLNFETPNWFNEFAPEKRDPGLWNGWRYVARYSTLILSSTQEGNKYAMDFYDSCCGTTVFDYCYPSINNIVADAVNGVGKEKRIVLITRFVGSVHKGGYYLSRLFCEAMEGYKVVLILGNGDVPGQLWTEIEASAKRYGIMVELKKKLSDYEKFREIYRSRLMLFPSFFEGFGYPPVEAQYCNVPCVAFDLPVLREVSGNGIEYVKIGDWESFRCKVGQILHGDVKSDNLRANVEDFATVESYAFRLRRVMERVMETEPVPLDDLPAKITRSSESRGRFGRLGMKVHNVIRGYAHFVKSWRDLYRKKFL